jgi:hypothetical protein
MLRGAFYAFLIYSAYYLSKKIRRPWWDIIFGFLTVIYIGISFLLN